MVNHMHLSIPKNCLRRRASVPVSMIRGFSPQIFYKLFSMICKETLDDEILKEIASVGGGYGKKIEYCMEQIKRIKKALTYLEMRMKREKKLPKLSIKLSSSLRKKLKIYKEEAFKNRYYLIVYREAIGLTNHRPVYEIYNIEKILENDP